MKEDRMIALFMGCELHEEWRHYCGAITHYKDKKVYAEIAYAKSWEWLVPVIRKIHIVEQKCYSFVDIDKSAVDVIDNVNKALTSLDLEETHKAVVNFIKYHTENGN
jgi:hypothetical protein